MFLAGTSPALARSYFANALRMCALTGVEPSVLLHPLDALGGDDVPELRFFPGMKLPVRLKLEILDWALGDLARRHTVLPMGEYARRAKAGGKLKVRQPRIGPVIESRAIESHTAPAA